MLVFIAWLCSSTVLIPQIEIGLDQEVTMPRDSFVLKYFQFLARYLAVGPPVYFVLNNTAAASGRGLDLSNKTTQNKICGSQGCNIDSLQVRLASSFRKKRWTKL